MKKPAGHLLHYRGTTLIESMLAVAVLAVAVPLVFAALGESGKSTLASVAETRSSWIISQCLEEIRASRDGIPRNLPSSKKGEPFPTSGDVWALAFSPTGKIIGRVPAHQFESGIRMLGEEPVRFIATLHTIVAPNPNHTPSLLTTLISIQYPSSAPAGNRRKIDFHTHIQ